MTHSFRLLMGAAFLLVPVLVLAQTAPGFSGEATLSYYGETLVHPGARFDLRTPLLTDGTNSLLVGATVGGYWHPLNSYAPFAGLNLGYRLTLPFGLVVGLEVGGGYRHVFLDGVVYESVGSVATPVAHWGYPELFSEANLALGWRFLGPNASALTLGVTLGLMGAYPVNYVTLWRPVAQITATVPFTLGGVL